LADLLRRPGFHYLDLERYGLSNPNLDLTENKALKLTSNTLAISSANKTRLTRSVVKPTASCLQICSIDTLSKEARENLPR